MLTAICGNLRRSKTGAAAVEFALVLPAFAALMFGTIQAGMLIFSYNMMVSAARDATRAMAVCSIDAPTAKAQALGRLPPWIPSANWSVTADDTDPDATMTISVPTAQAMIISYLPFDLPTLTTTITMLKEPNGYGGGSC